jgi:hypothetical protein
MIQMINLNKKKTKKKKHIFSGITTTWEKKTSSLARMIPKKLMANY